MCKLILILFTLNIFTYGARIKEVFNLKQIYFMPMNKIITNNSNLKPVNTMPVALERWKNKLFLVTPRLHLDVPVTLSYINITNIDSYKNISSPILIPYPNHKSQEISEHNLTSVIKIRADVCDRLWILDNGRINNKQENAPVLHVYSLKTDLHLRTFNLQHLTNLNSDLTNIEVDVTSSNCEDAYIYIPDTENYRLIVYSWKTNESYDLTHNYFHFDPLCGDIDLGEVHYQSQKGLYGLALSPIGRNTFRNIYFHSIASTMEFIVSSKAIKNKNYDKHLNVYDFKVMGTRGNKKQATSSSLDLETGVIFYGLLLKNAIGCWNSYSGEEYNELTQGTINLDLDTDLYPADVRADRTGNLWVLSNTFPIYNNKEYNPNLINVKIYMTPVRQVIKGTICDEI